MAKIIKELTKDDLIKISNELDSGQPIIIPTETVWGLAASAKNHIGLENIFKIKKRDPNKPVAVLIGSEDDIPLVAKTIPASAKKLIKLFWPGPLTIVLPINPNFAKDFLDYKTIGIRFSSDPVASKIVKFYKYPLFLTSANLSGQKTLKTLDCVLEQLGSANSTLAIKSKVDELNEIPSTVVFCQEKGPAKILRIGSLSENQLKSVLPNILI